MKWKSPLNPKKAQRLRNRIRATKSTHEPQGAASTRPRPSHAQCWPPAPQRLQSNAKIPLKRRYRGASPKIDPRLFVSLIFFFAARFGGKLGVYRKVGVRKKTHCQGKNALSGAWACGKFGFVRGTMPFWRVGLGKVFFLLLFLRGIKALM